MLISLPYILDSWRTSSNRVIRMMHILESLWSKSLNIFKFLHAPNEKMVCPDVLVINSQQFVQHPSHATGLLLQLLLHHSAWILRTPSMDDVRDDISGTVFVSYKLVLFSTLNCGFFNFTILTKHAWRYPNGNLHCKCNKNRCQNGGSQAARLNQQV